MKISDRLYERLRPDERFRVAMEAFGRQDWQEVDRLHGTVPDREVRVQEPAYFERLRGFHEIAMGYGLITRDLMLAVAMSLVAVLQETPDAGGADPEADSAADRHATMFGTSMEALIGHADAWSDFCRELGIDPDRTAFAGYERARHLIRDLHLDLEFDRDQSRYDSTLEGLRDQWEYRLSRIPRFASDRRK